MEHLANSTTSAPQPTCVACGAVGMRVIHRRCVDRLHPSAGEWAVVACTRCSLARTEPQPSRDELVDYYPPSYVSFSKVPLEKSRSRKAVSTILRMPYQFRWGVRAVNDPPYTGARALDVGCGIGLHLALLQERGWTPCGIEPSADAASVARRQTHGGEGEIMVSTVEDAEWPPKSFELVTMFHVLEHVHDPVGVLRKVGGWLGDEGLLRIRVPNVASAESRFFGSRWFGLDVPRHLYHFSPHTLETVLTVAGFKVDRVAPEFQASSFSGSLSHVLAAARRQRREYRHSSVLYHAVLPLAAVGTALGWSACIDVTARKESR